MSGFTGFAEIHDWLCLDGTVAVFCFTKDGLNGLSNLPEGQKDLERTGERCGRH